MRKWAITIAVLVCLMWTAVSSIAEGERSPYFTGYAELENAYGAYGDGWPAAAKTDLVRLMEGGGLAIRQKDAEKLLQGGLEQTRQDALASQILDSYFSGTEFRDLFNIMQYELGPFEDWRYQDKALYSSLLARYGKQKVDWALFLLPSQEDIQEREAVQRSADQLGKAFGVSPRQLLGSPVIHTSFLVPESDGQERGEAEGEPLWLVEFRDPEVYAGAYSVWLSRQGEVRSYQTPDTLPFYGEVDILAEATPATPSAHDASAELVTRYALESLTEVGDWTPQEIQGLRAQAHFIYHERFCYGWEPVWLIHLYQGDALVYKALYGYDGTHMGIAPAQMEFTNVMRPGFFIEEELGVNFSSFDFWGMTLQERADFSKQWNPMLDDYARRHPYFLKRPELDLLYLATRYTYGLPGKEDLLQEEALQLAREAILALGANQETLANRRAEVLFDVTREDKPLWKFFFFAPELRDRNQRMLEGNYQRYRVILDARTGEVLSAYVTTNEMTTGDVRF